MKQPSLILAIDPGNQKCGLALVDLEGKVLEKKVIAAADLLEQVAALQQEYGFELIVLGDRTNSKKFKAKLHPLGYPVELVDEDQSSVEGRRRYLKDNVRGIKKLIPLGLQTPDQPYDDYVAVILAERYLSKVDSIN